VKKFFIRVFFLFVLLFAGMGIIVIIPLPFESLPENILRIIIKYPTITNIKSPKIVLAGGSNIIYGMDSKAIHESFHIPVVNMGYTAGVGLGRILDDISRFLNTGDVLLVIPEYVQFTSAWNGDIFAYYMIFDFKQYRLLLSPYYGLPSDFFSYLGTRSKNILFTRSQNSFTEARENYNEYGDIIVVPPAIPVSPSGNLGVINQTYLKNFFRFVDDFTKRGITVILSYPSYEEQSFRNSAALIYELDALFRTKENLLVISTPESFCFPTDYFHDSVNHLKMDKRAVRTEQLIHDLQASDLFLKLPLAP